MEEADERDPAHTVGEHVMGSQVEGGATAGQTVDQRRVPRRPVMLKGDRLKERDQVQHLPLIAWHGDRHRPNMVADIEAGIIDPSQMPA